MIDFTRRKMLGVAAGTMASAVGTAVPESAAADDATDLALFVKVSAALTGIAEANWPPRSIRSRSKVSTSSKQKATARSIR